MIKKWKGITALAGVAFIFLTSMCKMDVKAAVINQLPGEKEKIELYHAEPVMNTEELMYMSVNGIDELTRDTGYKWKPEVAVRVSGIKDIKNYSTSQLINQYVCDGEVYNQYALTSITVADVGHYADPAVTGNGCTVRTTMVVTWGKGIVVSLNYQSTWVTGGAPTVLVMENQVNEGWDTGKVYVNSKEVIKPNGTYTLQSPSSVMVGDSYGSVLWCRGTVYFSGGSSIVSSYTLDPCGILP